MNSLLNVERLHRSFFLRKPSIFFNFHFHFNLPTENHFHHGNPHFRSNKSPRTIQAATSSTNSVLGLFNRKSESKRSAPTLVRIPLQSLQPPRLHIKQSDSKENTGLPSNHKQLSSQTTLSVSPNNSPTIANCSPH